jgi:iron(III) transport system ATP-binding protein
MDAIGLQVDGVSKRFAHRVKGEIYAARDVRLDVAPGEFLTLLGPSGCGKTTTLRMIAGFEAPDAGRIRFGGQDVTGLPTNQRNIGFVFQNYALFPHLSVFENVAYGLRVRGQSADAIRRSVGEVLALVGLAGYEQQFSGQLSGGEQQRVALARAIVVQPAVLLLDEPLSNLDANLREEMRYEIRRLHDEFHITTVYVTHDQAEAMVTSDRIAVMNQGRIEQVDEPRALYARPRTRFVAGFIGRTNFLDGEVRGAEVVFDHFAIALARFGEPPALRGKVAFSLRPQSLHLHRQPPAESERTCVIPGRVVRRAYLGEHWDYAVRPKDGELQLRVTARPHEVFEVNERVWLEVDPSQMALLG